MSTNAYNYWKLVVLDHQMERLLADGGLQKRDLGLEECIGFQKAESFI